MALIFGFLIPQTKAIINYFGLTAWPAGLEEFQNLSLNRDDPLDFVKKITCPVLSFHGDKDSVVPVENTYSLDNACRRFRVDHRYVIYPGINHSFIWPGDKYDKSAHLDSWGATLRFLKKNLLAK